MVSLSQKTISYIIGAILVLVPLVFYSHLRDHTWAPKLIALQILVTLALGIWTIKRNLQIPSLALPAFCYILLIFASALYATNPTFAILTSTNQLTGFIFFILVANHLTRQNILPILTASAITGLIVALLGTSEYWGWRPFTIPSSGLPSATLGFRNLAAMYIIQSLPLIIAAFVLCKSSTTTYFTAVTIALMSAFLVYTRTRGAWLGLAISTVFTCWLWWSSRSTASRVDLTSKRWPIGIAVFAFVILFSTPSGLVKQGPQSIDEKKTTIQATLTSITREGGDRGRLSTWLLTLPMIRDYPIFGVGQGNWQIHYPHYDRGTNITFNAAPERPHNNFLQILAETGIVGFSVYLWFCLAVIYTGWQCLKLANAQTRWISAGCLTRFIAILIHGLFSFPADRITPTLFFWLIPGIIASLSPKPQHTLKPSITTPILITLLLISLGQIAFTARVLKFDAHMYRAVLAEYRRSWHRVVSETTHALEQGAFHKEAIHLRGYALNAQDQYAAAYDHYSQALPQSPDDIQMLNGLAIAAQNLRKIPEAEQNYLKALELVDSPDLRYNLAGLYLQSGRATKAIEEYNRLLQKESPTLDFYYHLLHAYLFARQPQKAVDVMASAIALTPQGPDHFSWIELLYLHHKKPGIAIACYQMFIAKWTGQAIHIERAKARIQALKAMLQ